MHDPIFSTKERFALFGLAVAQAFLLLLILLPAPRPSDVLRVAAPDRERVTARLSPYGPGYEQELLADFCKRHGYELRWVKADDRQEALRLVADGYADVAVGFGTPADAPVLPGLSVTVPAPGGTPASPSASANASADAPAHDAANTADTPQASIIALLGRLAAGVTSAPLDNLVAGPAYDHARPVLVRWSEPATMQAVNAVARDSGADDAEPLRAALLLTTWETPVDPATFQPAAAPGDDAQRHAMLDGSSWRLWQPFVTENAAGRATDAPLSYHWYWRGDDSPLARNLADFWAARTAPGDTTLDDLTERYFGFLPASLGLPDDGGAEGPVDIYDLMELMETVGDKLPDHASAIRRAAMQSGVDPLLLAAVIFQESRFDPAARSKTGVRGIMQLTQNTAVLLKVNRMNPAQSIRGGARYLRMIWDSLEDLNLDPWDRWFFTLAGFNQGPGHLRDAIRLDRELGGSGRTWRELKETFPKLARPRYHSRTRYGYCRGYEAVAFVESVRYYYYILNGLVALSRPEAEHLAPLLEAAPVRWPAV